jgi:hypothetical protein
MNRRFSRIALASTLAGAAIAVAPTAAAADTVTLGSPLVSDYTGGISTSALSVQLSFDPATSTNPVVSPATGTITDWKVKSADDGAVYTLKVLRPNGPVSTVVATNTNFTAVTSSPAASPVPNGTFATTPTGVIFDHPASVPISKGDYVALLGVGGGGAHGLAQAMANGLPQSTFANNFASQPTDGNSADLLADAQHELLLQATVQFTPTPAATPATAKKKCKKKKKKRSAEIAKKKCKKHKKKH